MKPIIRIEKTGANSAIAYPWQRERRRLHSFDLAECKAIIIIDASFFIREAKDSDQRLFTDWITCVSCDAMIPRRTREEQGPEKHGLCSSAQSSATLHALNA